MLKIVNEFIIYIFRVITQTGNLVSGGIIGLYLIVVPFSNSQFLKDNSLFITIVLIILCFVIATFNYNRKIIQELEVLKQDQIKYKNLQPKYTFNYKPIRLSGVFTSSKLNHINKQLADLKDINDPGQNYGISSLIRTINDTNNTLKRTLPPQKSIDEFQKQTEEFNDSIKNGIYVLNLEIVNQGGKSDENIDINFKLNNQLVKFVEPLEYPEDDLLSYRDFTLGYIPHVPFDTHIPSKVDGKLEGSTKLLFWINTIFQAKKAMPVLYRYKPIFISSKTEKFTINYQIYSKELTESQTGTLDIDLTNAEIINFAEIIEE